VLTITVYHLRLRSSLPTPLVTGREYTITTKPSLRPGACTALATSATFAPRAHGNERTPQWPARSTARTAAKYVRPPPWTCHSGPRARRPRECLRRGATRCDHGGARARRQLPAQRRWRTPQDSRRGSTRTDGGVTSPASTGATRP